MTVVYIMEPYSLPVLELFPNARSPSDSMHASYDWKDDDILNRGVLNLLLLLAILLLLVVFQPRFARSSVPAAATDLCLHHVTRGCLPRNGLE